MSTKMKASTSKRNLKRLIPVGTDETTVARNKSKKLFLCETAVNANFVVVDRESDSSSKLSDVAKVGQGHVLQCESWWLNDLVLDCIFENLKTVDLKSVRLVCRMWCQNATRFLSKNGSLYLCDGKLRDEVQKVYGISVPDKFVDTTEFASRSVYDSSFKPRHITFFGSANIDTLPLRTLSRLTDLKISNFTIPDAEHILWNLHTDFPSIKILELTNPDPNVSLHSSKPCNTGGSSKLERLCISVPFIWHSFSWDFIARTGTLKELEIHQSFVGNRLKHSAFSAEHYGKLISSFPTDALNKTSVCLWFGSHGSTFRAVQKFCSSVDLQNVQLYVESTGNDFCNLVHAMPNTLPRWESIRYTGTDYYNCAAILGNCRRESQDETVANLHRAYSSITDMSKKCLWYLRLTDGLTVN